MFKVKSVNTRLPIPTFTLTNFDGTETLQGNFYGFELTLVLITDAIYRIEKVLRTRKKGRKRQYFVRWKGFGSEHDSWVDAKDFTGDFNPQQKKRRRRKRK